MTLARQSHQTLVFNVISFSFAVAASVLLARGLGVAGRGEYALLVLLANWGSFFTTMGFGTSASVLVSRKELSKDDSLTLAFGFLILSAVLTGFALWLVRLENWRFLGGVALEYPVYILAATLVFGFRGTVVSILQGLGRIKEMNLSNLVNASYPLLLVFFVLSRTLSVRTAVIAGVTCALIGSFYGIHVLGPLTARFSWSRMKDAVPTLYTLFCSNVIGNLNLRIDLLFVGYFLTARDAGIYAVALVIAELMFFVPGAMGSASLHRFGMEREQRRMAILGSSLRKTVLANLFICLLMILSMWWIIPFLFGSAFKESYDVLVILLVGYWSYALPAITTGFFNVARTPVINGAIAGCTLIIGVILNLILVPTYGIYGAAFATSVSYTIGMGLAVTILLKSSSIRLRDIFLFRRQDVTEILHESGRLFSVFAPRN